jgi:hypothetical protein
MTQTERALRIVHRRNSGVEFRALLAIPFRYIDSATIFATSAMAAARSSGVAVDPTE